MPNDNWEPPKDVKPWMVCAACRYQDHIVAAPRHFDETMRNQIEASSLAFNYEWEQGFIDQWGSFYSRADAMEAVRASGQPFNYMRNGQRNDELFSEGLY